SGHAIHRELKVRRTIADLSGAAQIDPAHLAQALQYQPRRDCADPFAVGEDLEPDREIIDLTGRVSTGGQEPGVEPGGRAGVGAGIAFGPDQRQLLALAADPGQLERCLAGVLELERDVDLDAARRVAGCILDLEAATAARPQPHLAGLQAALGQERIDGSRLAVGAGAVQVLARRVVTEIGAGAGSGEQGHDEERAAHGVVVAHLGRDRKGAMPPPPRPHDRGPITRSRPALASRPAPLSCSGGPRAAATTGTAHDRPIAPSSRRIESGSWIAASTLLIPPHGHRKKSIKTPSAAVAPTSISADPVAAFPAHAEQPAAAAPDTSHRPRPHPPPTPRRHPRRGGTRRLPLLPLPPPAERFAIAIPPPAPERRDT
ncbi:MAG: hypothetical protein KDC98_19875, partial [Planctomycetes bacterium]|nr:hypothetical protein [Planctomycetota bacterium]